MPSVKELGKDKVIFVTKEEHETPSKINLPEPEASPGLILPNGEINWNCPCLGGMATGPCGLEFRDAFSCFHYSTADPKGSDCYETFKTMQTCMSEYPSLYGNKDTDLDELEKEDKAINKINSNQVDDDQHPNVDKPNQLTNMDKELSNKTSK